MFQPHPPGRQPRHRPGFTLIEVLVVVGIIALLAGLVLPALLHARRTAIVTRTKSDLALIGTALEAYKHDFGDYPRFASPLDDKESEANAVPGRGTWLDYSADRGARLLCFALIAPGPAGTGAAAVDTGGQDGADGPGFRGRRTLIAGTTTLAGKVYSPYIDSSKFKIQSTQPNMSDAKLLDGSGMPILYYPALPGPAQTSINNGYINSVTINSSFVAGTPLPLYNFFDNSAVWNLRYGVAALDQFRKLTGDLDFNGTIEPAKGESAVTSQPYLLWTAGADAAFGLDAAGKSDDVCNFDVPLTLRK